ncbi:MAG: hypothetical protein JKY56_22885 [Kofleriaceae bacterium]|nr:hypothetical protein [Kofleriaceae bacterium]
MINKRISFSKNLVSSLAACVALFALAGSASADTANCKVVEIKASTGKAEMDPALAPIAAKLKKPPFSAWQSFKVVKQHKLAAEQMKQASLVLATGGKLGLLYKDRNDAKGKKPRLRIAMTLDDASGKRRADISLKVDSGDYTLLGRDAAKDGSTHLLAISCSVK